MHIPDGYLSPQTTIPLFVLMVPIWRNAIQKTKETFPVQQISKLSISSAFCFVIMMFNIPLGVSSVHAIGAVLLALLLGPWAACLCISITLAIQAVVFGDGGILAFGANAMVMGFIMPFTGYYLFRLLRGKGEIVSRRGFIAGALSTYVGVNVGAFVLAILLGIQPLLFTSSKGVPLYGFYGLNVTLPVIMGEHLLIVGPVEMLLTASVLGFLRKGNPDWIVSSSECMIYSKRFVLVYSLFLLLLLSPLGLIATGTGFGEWDNSQIQKLIGYIPHGLQQSNGIWKALLPDYNVPSLQHNFFKQAVGYIICGMLGVGLVSYLSQLLVVNKKIKKESTSL